MPQTKRRPFLGVANMLEEPGNRGATTRRYGRGSSGGEPGCNDAVQGIAKHRKEMTFRQKWKTTNESLYSKIRCCQLDELNDGNFCKISGGSWCRKNSCHFSRADCRKSKKTNANKPLHDATSLHLL